MAAIAHVEVLEVIDDAPDDAWVDEMSVTFDVTELTEFFAHFDALDAPDTDDDQQ